MRPLLSATALVIAVLSAPVLAQEEGASDAPSGLGSGETPSVVATVASFPAGTFLENLAVRDDGAVLFTNYLAKTVEVLGSAGAVSDFAALGVHPVGILDTGGKVVTSAHGVSFLDGPGFTTTNQFLVLASDGTVEATAPAPDALFLNGLVELAPDLILAADSLAGTIWAFEPSTGTVTPWLKDDLLLPSEDGGGRPGANGLKLHDGALHVSNSARGAKYRVALQGLAPAGTPEVVASLPVDDFLVLDDGAIVAATHAATLLHVADGTVTEVMAEGCDGCTSVARQPNGDLLVLTTGDLLAGGDASARVLRVPAALLP